MRVKLEAGFDSRSTYSLARKYFTCIRSLPYDPRGGTPYDTHIENTTPHSNEALYIGRSVRQNSTMSNPTDINRAAVERLKAAIQAKRKADEALVSSQTEQYACGT